MQSASDVQRKMHRWKKTREKKTREKTNGEVNRRRASGKENGTRNTKSEREGDEFMKQGQECKRITGKMNL